MIYLIKQDPEQEAYIASVIMLVLIIALIVIIIALFYRFVKISVDLFRNNNYYNRNLLILASKVIKANGKVNKVEQDYVRNYFIKNYGKRKANKAFRQFKKVTLHTISTREIAKKVYSFLTYQESFDFVKFLFSIAHSDGKVTKDEELEIRKIASYLSLRRKDYEYLKSNFFKDFNKKATLSYYKDYNYLYETLGLLKSASNIEVKKAYRELAKKHHPDKFVNFSKEDLIVNKEKFQIIQDAYQKIKKNKGF